MAHSNSLVKEENLVYHPRNFLHFCYIGRRQEIIHRIKTIHPQKKSFSNREEKADLKADFLPKSRCGLLNVMCKGNTELMELKIGNSSDIIKISQIIRHKVFVDEQGIPLELDLDGLDEKSSHALLTDNGSLIATARLYSSDGKHSVMARVAVTNEYRGNGIAAKIINALIFHAKKSGFSTIEIHAHEYLKKYYEKFGFAFVQNVEIVGGHQLIEMQLQLNVT